MHKSTETKCGSRGGSPARGYPIPGHRHFAHGSLMRETWPAPPLTGR